MYNKTIKIVHKQLGILLEESFVDPVQFKIFLQMVDGCFANKSDLDFFNGKSFFIHVPFEILKESVILGKWENETLTEKMIGKSLIETP